MRLFHTVFAHSSSSFAKREHVKVAPTSQVKHLGQTDMRQIVLGSFTEMTESPFTPNFHTIQLKQM